MTAAATIMHAHEKEDESYYRYHVPPSHPPRRQLVERCVLVARQADGYGLTVTGEHPVFVNTVRQNGAAFIAGVRQGDQVVKVNGMPVTSSNYQEVLRMISGGHNLALTLLSETPLPIFSYMTPTRSINYDDGGDAYDAGGNSSNGSFQHSNDADAYNFVGGPFAKRESIQSNQTEPIPSSHQQKRQSVQELYRMLDKEQRHLEILKQVENVGSTRSAKLERALQRISQLQEQLQHVDTACADGAVAGCSTTFRSVKSGASPSAPSSLIGESDYRPHAHRLHYHHHHRDNHHHHRTGGPGSAVSSVAIVEPVKSWVESGGLHYVQANAATTTTGGDLLPMEEDVEDDVDHSLEESSGAFSNLIDLKGRPAHLAVFISYLVNNSNPNSLLFYLISDAFQSTGSTKELRRFAYEIFSTFLIPNAPLQLPDVTQLLIQQIDKVLRAASLNGIATASTTAVTPQDAEQLRRLFLPARTRAIGAINERLAQFRRRRALCGGADAVEGVDVKQLNAARTDHNVSAKIVEQVLCRLLESLVAQCSGNVSFDGDASDARKLALVASVATIIKVVMGLKPGYSPWEKLLEKCPTFVTSAKSTMLSKMKPKRSVQVKDHQFTLNPVCLTVYCYQCREVFWGVNPQAYFCQYCDVVVHKQCTVRLVDHCYPVAAQQQKRSTGNVSGGVALATRTPAGGAVKVRAGNSPAVSASSVSLDAARINSISTPDAVDYGDTAGRGGGSTSNVYGYYHQSRISAPDSCMSIGSSAGELTRAAVRQNASCTPPLCRSHASTATIVGSTAAGPSVGRVGGGLNESRSHLNYAINDEADEDAEADAELITNLDGSKKAARPMPSVHTATAATVSSSPASSSKSILPPPVFSQKFERIVPPLPPVHPQLAEEPVAMTSAAAHLATASANLTAAAAADNAAKSMSSDSGIGNELLLVGADGRAISRAHSMKVEATNQSNQIRRNGRGANSLGAADSTTGSIVAIATTTRDFTQSRVANNADSERATQLPTGLVIAPKCIVVSPTLHHSSEPELQSQLLKQPPSQSQPSSLTASTSTLRATTPSVATISDTAADAERRLMERVESTVIPDTDSDLDVDTEVPPLESQLSWEVLRHLKPKEKKRQEVINELFHTERTHLRNLKILYKLFYRPMVLQKIESPELIQLLFGNLDALLTVHNEMYAKMRAAIANWRQQFAAGTLILAGGVKVTADVGSETGSAPSSTAQSASAAAAAAAAISSGGKPPYGNIGELIECIFDGKAGERLMAETALFCQNQQHALDTLRQRYNRSSKDDSFSTFLAEAESNPLCRKLQLKDMIPVEMQRLVKYPLLLETVAKYTPDPSDELTRLMHGATCAKRILSAVNTAKRNAENRRRLEDLQKRVDLCAQNKFASFFQKFDFRNHRLIYEGTLLWRQARGKTVELHVVLLDHLLVFLTRSGGDSTPSGGPNVRWQLKVAEAGCLPIMLLSYVRVEEKTGDKRAFNLLYKCDLRLFELVAPTATERKTWHRLIENQIAVSSQDLPTAGDELTDFFNATTTTGTAATTMTDSAALPASTSITVVKPVGDGGAHTMEQVEQVHVLTHPNLVTANQIVVEQPKILEHAQLEQAQLAQQPQLSLIERLRRYDKVIVNALNEKHILLAQMLKQENENADDLEKITEQLAGLSVAELKHRNTRELAVSTIVFGNRLLDSINTGMTTESAREAKERALPSVPCYKLTAVAAPLMNHIKALTQLVQEQEHHLPLTQRQSSSNDIVKTKTLVMTPPPCGAPPLTHRNNHVGIVTALIGDDSAPPPLPPSSAPPPLD